LFRNFLFAEAGSDQRRFWTPRPFRAFKDQLKKVEWRKDKIGYSDRTINRTMAHLKTFAKWIHKISPFPLGNPMAKLKLMPIGTGLEVERAITPAERRPNAGGFWTRPTTCPRLVVDPATGTATAARSGRSEKGIARPFRNRAIVYTLIETGMRRAAVRNLNLKDVDFKKRSVSAEEKGGRKHTYKITGEGLAAIKDYIEKERKQDHKRWKSPALFLFLSPATTANGNGRLSPKVINTVWNEVCQMADVEGHTPHAVRHAMGKHLIEKTGNLAAVQRQLGHTNATFSMQYTWITDEELGNAIEDR
jgi:integrase